MQNQKIVIIGGSSGIGLETAKQIISLGGEVIIASRSEDKLHKAKEMLGPRATIYVLDTTDEQQVKSFFEKVGSYDHLVVSAAETSGGSFLQSETTDARKLFENKFWGQYYAAKYGSSQLSTQGSITLFSGVVAYKPMVGSSALGAVNAAVSNLGQTLALELAPIRVNVVSPGIIDTPSRSKMSENTRNQFYGTVANRLPVKRVGLAEDVARGVLYLIENQFVTGTVLHVDGGHILT
ncbi:NAD(P)-dependent dehydrogenase (short-subunit alcohol dehydrogenase family) [Paenibacillus jamilae]|uniref:SDR family oxidoreductase n=1 Tax=Paenibacillus TaxID=44249 RepID=UPI0007EA089D|nr:MULTISPECIES: SDR family oxidoreductase [Paenibacillus]MCV9950172.1 SDR family oxidoreductase [Paenibacillus sp. BT-177]MDP9677677.1 NAD(P)-dependent dehydrogenase (short-subunit alcohol dehydrogenase family) [Paenibacillus jamilae]KAF6563329.1 SDR family oxidoreductase [Paenibacillus sp. EKM202P]KAF6570075.1 SDR family oxidoreductase [Paenibacillus sp. EKM207P]KAF6621469.1 SDR family oxidoreductase [Paenibacillus sp. EKM101P]